MHSRDAARLSRGAHEVVTQLQVTRRAVWGLPPNPSKEGTVAAQQGRASAVPHPVLAFGPLFDLGCRGPGLLTDPPLYPRLLTVGAEQTLSLPASLSYNPDATSVEPYPCTSDAPGSPLLTHQGGLGLQALPCVASSGLGAGSLSAPLPATGGLCGPPWLWAGGEQLSS